MQHAPRAQFGDARVVQRVLRGLRVRAAKAARTQKNPAEIPRHDAQHVLYALAFEHVQNRLTGRALRLAVVAVTLLTGVQDVGPAVVPRVVFLLFDGFQPRSGLGLCRDRDDQAQKARFLFHIFRCAFSGGDQELFHYTSSITY